MTCNICDNEMIVEGYYDDVLANEIDAVQSCSEELCYMNNFNCKQCDAYYDEEYVDVRIWICEKCENSMVEILG